MEKAIKKPVSDNYVTTIVCYIFFKFSSKVYVDEFLNNFMMLIFKERWNPSGGTNGPKMFEIRDTNGNIIWFIINCDKLSR